MAHPVAAQHMVRRRRVPTQIVFVHQKHRSRLARCHCQMWLRARLIGQDQHSARAEISIELIEGRLILRREQIKHRR